ncbi:DUF6002 family protein [Streptomyces sp. NPDC005438]|uniref:DUF6002 family protein n=1 Tax=Streptomyces sp. NPDC005438 TaxID=3156880 RepID=UPI0033A88E91
MSASQTSRTVRVENVLARDYDRAREAARLLAAQIAPGRPGFEPDFELPPMTEDLRHYLAVSDVSVHELDDYQGHSLTLLNMMGNPGTRTTVSSHCCCGSEVGLNCECECSLLWQWVLA